MEIFYSIRLNLSNFPVVLTSLVLEVIDQLTNIIPVIGKPNTILNIHKADYLVRYEDIGIISDWKKGLVF